MKTLSKVLMVIAGIFLIVTGLYCLFTPGLTYLMVGYAIGLSIVIDAFARFVFWWQAKKEGMADGWMLTSAILSSVLGFFILNDAILQLGIDVFIVYYIASWLIIQGIIMIIRACKLRNAHKEWDTQVLGTRWYLPLILGILIIAFGILSIFNPVIIAAAIGIFIGLGIISCGASLITFATTPSM